MIVMVRIIENFVPLDLKRTVDIGPAEERNMSLKANDSHTTNEKNCL
jgi:hypothetical protein